MPQGRDKLTNVLKLVLDQKENKIEYIPALMGRYNATGVKEVVVADKKNFIWVRLRGQDSELAQAFNDKVGLNFNSPVLLSLEPLTKRYYIVVSRDISLYASGTWTNGSGLVFHGDQHSFSASTESAKDIVWIYKRQIVQPFLVTPTIPASMAVDVDSDYYLWNQHFKYFAGGTSSSLATYLPAPGVARYVTVYLDCNADTIGLIAGSTFGNISAAARVAFIPSIGTSVGINLAAVLLTAATTSIQWTDLYDLRVFISAGGDGVIGTGTAGRISQWATATTLGDSPLTVDTSMHIKPAGAVSTNVLQFDGNFWVPGAGGGGGGGGGSGAAEFVQLEYGSADISVGTVTDVGWVDVDATHAALLVTPSTAGTYQVTFSFEHQTAWSGVGDIEVYFRLFDGTTVLATTKVDRHNFGGLAIVSADVNISGLFTWDAPTLRTIKLQKQVIVANNVTTNILTCSGGIVLHMDAFRLSGSFAGAGNPQSIAYWLDSTTLDFDSLIFVDKSAHRIISGGATISQLPASIFTASVIAARLPNKDSGFSSVAWSSTAGTAPFFNTIRARGTPDVPTKILSGDMLGRFASRGFYDNGAGLQAYTNEVARLLFYADEDYADPFTWGSHATIQVTTVGDDTLIDAFDVYPNRIVIVGKNFKLDADIELDPTGASDGNSLGYNGTKWVARDPDILAIEVFT